MKNIFLLVTTLLVIVSCGRTDYNFSLEGTVKGVSSGTVYLQNYRNKTFYVIDSAEIKEGNFRFSRDLELPEIYGLTLDTAKFPYMVFFDESPVTVTLDSARYYRNTKVEGSASQDLFEEYKGLGDIAIDSFIREHPASLVSAYALYRYYSNRLSPDELQANIQLLDSALWNTHYVQTIEKLIPTLEVVTVGKEAPDFTASDHLGNEVKFSDHLGKGYVLLDFWASWCGPCRRDNPNVVNVYQKYKDKDFDVFAVSLDKSKEGWLQAIEKDHLSWTHVSDLRFWDSAPAGLYGVRVIPSNFLIDKNGVIVAKNLRGEALDLALNEFLH